MLRHPWVQNVAICLCLLPTTALASAYPAADYTCDNAVNILDIVRLVNVILGEMGPSDCADEDGDGHDDLDYQAGVTAGVEVVSLSVDSESFQTLGQDAGHAACVVEQCGCALQDSAYGKEDNNCDGAVNVLDIVQVVNLSLEQLELQSCADADADGHIDAAYVAGFITGAASVELNPENQNAYDTGYDTGYGSCVASGCACADEGGEIPPPESTWPASCESPPCFDGYAAELVGLTMPVAMAHGSQSTVIMQFFNAGSTTWLPGEVALGAVDNDDPLYAATRVPLTSSITPGEVATFSFILHAPVLNSPRRVENLVGPESPGKENRCSKDYARERKQRVAYANQHFWSPSRTINGD